MNKLIAKYNQEVSDSINRHISSCSEEQRKKEVSAFDTMCSKFLKNIKKGSKRKHG